MPTSSVGAFNDRRRSRGHASRGFTLIELVMVMAIISVIAAIVLPRLDPFVPQRRLKSAARLLSGTISLAYGEAISKNKTFRLYFDADKGTYWLTEVEKIEEEDESESSAVGIRIGTQFELLEYVEGEEKVEERAPTEPLFAPKELPPGVHFASIEVGRDITAHSNEVRYIEFNPLGSASPATIHLVNDEGDQFVVRYDGVTGMPRLEASRTP
ncbi:MAG: hypothetical protein Kow0099_05940 [Candidatus Abyssubacteria bacterium]